MCGVRNGRYCRDEGTRISAEPVLACLSKKLEEQMCISDFRGHYLMAMGKIDISFACTVALATV